MALIVPDAPLITVDDLAVYLHRSGFDPRDLPAAEAAVREACGLVLQRLGFDPFDVDFAMSPHDLDAARAVAKRVAAQHFTNPEQRQSYAGPDGLSYAGATVLVGKIMTEADRVVLEALNLRYAPGFGA